MKMHRYLFANLVMLIPMFGETPRIENIRVKQLPDTRAVEITYDLQDSDSPYVSVSLTASADGGQTFALPLHTLSGNIGANVPVGPDRLIRWDAAADWPAEFSANVRFRLVADDTSLAPTLPVHLGKPIIWLPNVTSLEPGVANALPEVPTIGLTPPVLVLATINNQTMLWCLEWGTSASSDAKIQPADYHPANNAKCWRKLNLNLPLATTQEAGVVSIGTIQNETNKVLRYFRGGQARLRVPPVSANPPSISKNSTSQISPSSVVRESDPLWRYVAGDWRRSGSTYPDYLFYSPYGINGLYNYPAAEIEFDFDGTSFEIYVKDFSGTGFRVLVDGEYSSTNLVTTAQEPGQLRYYKVDFGFAKPRQIRIETAGKFHFGGLVIGKNDSLYPSTLRVRPRCVILGDSYVEGSAAGNPHLGFAKILGQLLDWECWNSGSGGTGYTAGGTQRFKYLDRLDTDVVPYDPDIVIIEGGRNDWSSTNDTFAAAVTSLLDATRAKLPKAEIYVLGPLYDNNTAVPAQLRQFSAIIKTAAESRGIYYMDPIAAGQEWITGSRGSSEAGGNAIRYVSADNVHYTAAGHEYIAYRVANALLGHASQ